MMDQTKGMGRCGLACCLCDEHAECRGCGSDGCPDRAGCQNYTCSIQRGLSGCKDCDRFPCDAPMLRSPRMRAFAALCRELGDDAVMALLAARENEGIRYHVDGGLTGDYDAAGDEAAIRDLVLHGRKG